MDTKNLTWTRHAFTTRGSDPTEIVTWRLRDKGDHAVHYEVELEEFQTVITVKINGRAVDNDILEAALVPLHKKLEDEWQTKQYQLATEEEDACPGCGCMPGDGRTKGCTDPDGCGYFTP
jgi:hypothetical protein